MFCHFSKLDTATFANVYKGLTGLKFKSPNLYAAPDGLTGCTGGASGPIAIELRADDSRTTLDGLPDGLDLKDIQ
jgi:hypothetical protein